MPKRGFYFDLADEIENNANVHREIVSRIEKITGRNLVCYMANPAHIGGAIQDHDPDLLENVLRSFKLDQYGNKLDLLVSSPGGFPYAAGKIVKVCRTFATEFRTIVISRAMSAGTLLCLGSQELIMSETASLGPIDPQIARGGPGGQRLVPAQVIIDSFREILGAAQQAIVGKQPPDPFFHVLDSLDVTAVFESMKAVSSTTAIAANLLRDGLLRNDHARIDGVVKSLITEGQKELHGKHLYPSDLQGQIGLPVSVLAKGSDLDKLLRNLAVRIDLYLNNQKLAKYVLTRQGGINMNVQIVRA